MSETYAVVALLTLLGVYRLRGPKYALAAVFVLAAGYWALVSLITMSMD